MDKILAKKNLPQWVKNLEKYTVYSPQKEKDLWSYEITDKPESVDLDFLNTTVPSKKIIFPQREIFFEFSDSEEGLKAKEILPDEKPAVIFGIRPCEGKAFTSYDKVFSGDFDDPYYWKRRKNTSLIGLACNTPPSSNCFCLSVEGSPHSKDGLDILLTDLGDNFYVESFTKNGEKLLNEAKNIFFEPKAEDKKQKDKIQKESEKKIKRQIKDLREIHSKLKDMFDSPFWDKESMSCIRCGICTFLCPTCHCFDMNDEVSSTAPLKGKKVRTWDNCQFPDFTMHSSGHNPRPDKASRLRQRLLHKFQYFVEVYGDYQCTGCGRCISLCPVGIDIIEVLDKVRDYE